LPLVNEPSTHPGPQTCSIKGMLPLLPADEQADLISYLTDPATFPTITAGQIVHALAARDIPCAVTTIHRHRRGECVSCRLSPLTPPASKP